MGDRRCHEWSDRPASRKFEVVRLGEAGRPVRVQTYVTRTGQFVACYMNQRLGRERFDDLVETLQDLYQRSRRYRWRPAISIEVSRGSTWDKGQDGECLYVRANPIWLAEHEDGECPEERPTLYHVARIIDGGEIEGLAECHPGEDPLLGARRYQPADGERSIPWSRESWLVVCQVIETLADLRGRLDALFDRPELLAGASVSLLGPARIVHPLG